MRSLTWNWLIFAILSLPTPLFAQFGTWEDSMRFEGEWGSSQHYEKNIKGFAERPAANVLDTIFVEWQPIERDPLGNLCKVRGQLRIPDGVKSKPVNWFQGITLYMAKRPGTKLDLSAGINRQEAAGRIGTVDKVGAFELRVDLRLIQSHRNVAQSFQFGVALATHDVSGKDQHVTWTSKTPAIPSSVRLLNVPTAPKISHELELVVVASRWPGLDPDSVNLIRAVNALRLIGKQQALLTLEKYAELIEGSGRLSDRDVVFLIIQLLFEPIQLEGRFPVAGIGFSLVNRESPESVLWPINPMEMIGDVPFVVGTRSIMDGEYGYPVAHIQYARLHCVMRDHPLSPTMNPLAAADTILSSPKFRRLDEYKIKEATESIRNQALAMVSEILKPLPDVQDEDHTEADIEWKARLAEAQKMNIVWDAKAERFVAQNK